MFGGGGARMGSDARQAPRWVVVYHLTLGSLLLAASVALGVQWPEAVRSPGSGRLALYPGELLVYVGLTLVSGLWLLVTALGMYSRRRWGFWWARCLHALLIGFGAVVACPYTAFGLYLIVFNPHPGGARDLDFSDRTNGTAIVAGCAPALLLAAFSWRCWVRLRGAGVAPPNIPTAAPGAVS
jgi:hypothetical protein